VVFGESRRNRRSLVEEKDRCIVSLDMPGLEKKDIKIDFENRWLLVSAKTDKRDYSFNVPLGNIDLDTDKTTASYEAGVLRVEIMKKTIPKRTIEVK
jgi:HSP20 family molecular chaperone IbpA